MGEAASAISRTISSPTSGFFRAHVSYGAILDAAQIPRSSLILRALLTTRCLSATISISPVSAWRHYLAIFATR